MPSKKNRVDIPAELAAQVLFHSDRTCCVCRTKGKATQIHHIDDNPSNNVFENLAVLCFDCHTETQVRGGFHRKLDGEQVVLYRDDWLNTVAKMRATDLNRLQGIEAEDVAIELELATSLAEIYRGREEYELLALHYLSVGNNDLRDKYIDLAIQQGIDDDSLIFFRSEQGRLDLVPQEVINRLIYQLESRANWFSLGRLYVRLEQPQNATRATCRGVIKYLIEKSGARPPRAPRWREPQPRVG